MRSTEFKLLLLPSTEKLNALAFRMLQSREEAEDLVQEVFIRLWDMRDKLKEYRSPEALAMRMTRNLCLDQLRKRKVRRQTAAPEGTDPENSGELAPESGTMSENPHSQMERREDQDMIRNLVEELPEPQRSLVQLRHLEEKEYDEIARIMHMNVNAIRVSLSRARKDLRQKMEKRIAL